MNQNEQQRVAPLQMDEETEYNDGWAAFGAGTPLDPTRPKAWRDGWSDSRTNTDVNAEDVDVERHAYHLVTRLAKYGSRRTKVLIRKSSKYTLPGIVAVVRSARATRLSAAA